MEGGLYEGLRPLRDRLNSYRSASDGPVRAEHARTIQRLAVTMDLHVDLGLDSRAEWSDDDFFRLSNHVETIDGAKVVQGFYTLGNAFSESEIDGTAELMAIDPIAYSLVRIDSAKGAVKGDPFDDAALFERRYRQPARRAYARRARGEGVETVLSDLVSPEDLERAHGASELGESVLLLKASVAGIDRHRHGLRDSSDLGTRERGARPRRRLRRAVARGRPHRQSRRRPDGTKPLLDRRRTDAFAGGVDGGTQAGGIAPRRAPAAARRVSEKGRLHALADRLHRHRGRDDRPDLLSARRGAGLGSAWPRGRSATDPVGRPRPAAHRRRRPDGGPASGPGGFAPRVDQPRRRDGGRGERRGRSRQLRPCGAPARRRGNEGEGPLAGGRAPLLHPAGLRRGERQLRDRHHGDGRTERPLGGRRRGGGTVPA